MAIFVPSGLHAIATGYAAVAEVYLVGWEGLGGARVKATQWGGEIGGLRQEIGHAPLARVGARAVVAWDGGAPRVQVLVRP